MLYRRKGLGSDIYGEEEVDLVSFSRDPKICVDKSLMVVGCDRRFKCFYFSLFITSI